MHVFWVVISIVYLLSPTLSWSEGSEGSIDIKRCQAALADEKDFQSLTSEQQTFFQEVLLPAAGMRVLYEQKEQVRKCSSTKQCFTLIFDDAKDIKFEWVSDTSEKEPWIETSRELNTLKIPEGYSFDSVETAVKLVRRFLIGHPLHPFNANKEAGEIRESLGEPKIIFKEAQLEAGDIGEQMVEQFLAGDRSKRKYGVIGPTGFGKSEILKRVVAKILSAQRKENLHVLLADQNRLVGQLIDDLETIRHVDGMPPFRVVRWGGKEKASSIAAIVKEAQQSNVPVVLATSVQSFRDRALKKNSDLGSLRQVLASFSFDEGHHLDAEQAKTLVYELIDHPEAKAFMYATTATPFRTENENFIYDIFGVESEDDPSLIEAYLFWCYKNRAATFFDQDFTQHRQIKDVVDQLKEAITSGELTPFDKVYFIEPATLGPDAFDSKGLKEKYFDIAIQQLLPLLSTHRRAFFTIRSQERAKKFSERLSEILALKGSNLTNDYSHSNRSQQTRVWDDFKTGKIDILVSVRQFDEGINVPDLSLYIDLNRTVGVRQLLQRMGRVLRIFSGKEYADVVLFMAMNAAQIAEMLDLLHELRSGSLRAPPKVAESRDRERSGGQDDHSESLFEISEAAYLERLDELIKAVKFWEENQNASPAAAYADQVNDYVEAQRREGKTLRLPSFGSALGVNRATVDSRATIKHAGEERRLRQLIQRWKNHPEFRALVDNELLQLFERYEKADYLERLGMDINKLFSENKGPARFYAFIISVIRKNDRKSELWKHVDREIFLRVFEGYMASHEKEKHLGSYAKVVENFENYMNRNGFRLPQSKARGGSYAALKLRQTLGRLRGNPNFVALLGEREKIGLALLSAEIDFTAKGAEKDPKIAVETWVAKLEEYELPFQLPPENTKIRVIFDQVAKKPSDFELSKKAYQAVSNFESLLEEVKHQAEAEKAKEKLEREYNDMPSEKMQRILDTQQMKGPRAFQTFLLENAVFEYANADEVLTELIKVDPNPLSVFLDREEVFNHYASLGEDGLKRWGALVRTAIDQDTTGGLQDYLFGEDTSYEYPERLQYIPN